jgi:hypothetical protein
MAFNAAVKALTLLFIAAVSGSCFAAGLTTLPTVETCPDPGNKGDSANKLPGKNIGTSAVTSPLDGGPTMPSLTYRYKKVDYNLAQFLKITKVAGFIVLHRGKVVKSANRGRRISASVGTSRAKIRHTVSTTRGWRIKRCENSHAAKSQTSDAK